MWSAWIVFLTSFVSLLEKVSLWDHHSSVIPLSVDYPAHTFHIAVNVNKADIKKELEVTIAAHNKKSWKS
jgi:hypothetical protein